MVKRLAHLEGLSIFLLSCYLYWILQFDLVLFLAVFLLPDLSMVGYLIDKKLGALCYNLIHNYSTAVVFVILGIAGEAPIITALGIILAAHIGIDRFLGYGLKYPTHFKDTHLQKL
ncbi:MAG: DUF4260 domain-containing protein [Patescibacteria group bacterium]